MHSKIKDTVAEERARAANAIEIVTETQEDEKRNLQNGLQQAVARNYRHDDITHLALADI